MALNFEQIEEILDTFDDYMEKQAGRHPAWRTRCRLCNYHARRQLNRSILLKNKTDREIATELKVAPAIIRHHRLYCLPNRGGAPLTDVERIETHTRERFPTVSKPWSQKLWILKELLFIRDEALRKNPPDRRELLRLAKEIDQASDALNKAKAEHRAARRAAEGAHDDLEEDLNPEQRAEMSKVPLGGSSNGRS